VGFRYAPARGFSVISDHAFRRRIARRSFLARVSGGALGFGALALVSGCAPPAGNDSSSDNGAAGDKAAGNSGARAGLTDCDAGPNADEAGQGRLGNRTGFSDTDSGANADPAGCGRPPRPGAPAPVTDSDRGRLADPAGRGRGPAARYSDNDIGWSADPIGRGQRGRLATTGNSQ